ncbi:hypothetical protein NQ315_012548 [Exocentrus adspersus]|uniref:DUF7041 domain-containing protein n=1 Tax=Exocentrus adspersus TaxID=1586481 RepID=A0AAV8VCK3_9CUCU|nr:hypothetical protein NQ315_012548 [Exocentrus adspersus]
MPNDNSLEVTQDVNVNQIFSFKLPPFWTVKPEIWFTQIEAQFNLNKITADKTKYNHDVIINRLTASEEKRLDELLSGSEIGDRKPSEFYRDMMNVVGGSQMVSQDLLLKLWKRRLPKTILMAITASGKENINDIVTLADKIWESYQLPNTTQNFNNLSVLQSNSNSVHEFSSTVRPIDNQLLKAFNDFSTNNKKRNIY